MTEQEAIKYLKDASRNNQMVGILPKSDIGKCLIKALEEIQKYRELERKLNGVDLTMLVNHWMEMAAEGEIQGYQRGRVLTNEDADKWDAYLSIGTPEECRTAVEKQKEIKNNAVDDFVERAMKQFTDFDLKHGYPTVTDCKVILRDIAERTKGSVANE